MSQYESRKSSGTSRSRGKGAARRGGTGASMARSRNSGGRRSSGRRPSGRRGGSGFDFARLAGGGVALIAAIACISLLVRGISKDGGPESTAETTALVLETETEKLQKQVSVDGIDITGMSMEDAKAALLKEVGWDMKVTWQDQTYQVADLMEPKIDALLTEIYSGEPKESYTLDTSGLEDGAKAEAANVAAQWDKKAKNGSISSYDKENDKFLFTGAQSGQAVDQEKLAADLLAALQQKNYTASIAASVNSVEPEFSESTAKEKYKTIGTFTTNTTANSKRNTNIKLAAQAINGIILQPGEEFSFNDRVGERTEAKGYKGAAAYNNGEVVEEIGGGVCQVSSTLYNAVVKSGLKTTVRRSHTFEPTYVTPGTDATVSWGGPDYAFVNNSSTSVGIRASYYNQTVTVSIYGIPVLEEGETYSLKSTKKKDMDLPAPTYEEDPTLAPGTEKVKSAGTQGSYWETQLVITKDGKVVSDKIDHTVTYKGHAPVILRNSSSAAASTEAAESSSDAASIQPSASEGTAAASAAGGAQEMPGTQQSPAAPTQAPAPQTTAAPAPSQPGGEASAPTAAGEMPTIAPMPGA